MKRRTIQIASMAALIAFTACDDMLDLEPKSQITETEYFKTESDLQLFSNSFYSDLLDMAPYDDQSDLFVQQNLSNEMIGGTKRTVPESGGGWSWTTLRKINTLINRAPQCEDTEAVTKYTALARFFRAYFYFEKVKRFGDVPWYETELSSNDEALYNPRDSRELILTHMLEDIDYAIANLPDKKAEKSAPYRATKWAALALKAQFCLYEGTYRKYQQPAVADGKDYTYYLEQAAQAAESIINSGAYKLYTTGNPEKDYLMLFAEEQANTDEYILAINFDHGMRINHNASAFTLVPTQGRPGLTRKLVNTYLMKDGSRFTDHPGWEEMSFMEEIKDRDPRLTQTVRGPGYTRIGQTAVLPPDLSLSVTGYHPIKFVQDPTQAGGNIDRNDYATCDLPVYRYAEVLLNFAEAKAELGTITQADIDKSINVIRSRVDMPGLDMAAANANPDPYMASAETGYTNVTGSNKGVILEIRRERAIELTQEGFRFDDLVRWKAGTCINQPITGMYFPGPGEYDLSGDGQADVILYSSGSERPELVVGVQVFELGKDLILTDGDRGYVSYHKNIPRTPFNEGRDYLYPIPINERSLNHNLTQNPGWDDGLDF